MTQIIINHDGLVSNKQALKAIGQFIEVNMDADTPYQSKRSIKVDEVDIAVLVEEVKHPDEGFSPCSVIFNVTKKG